MPFIQLVLALILLTIIYRRMIRREAPAPIGRAQAVVPVLFGVLSTILSFAIFMGLGIGVTSLGYDGTKIPSPMRSLISAALQAGIPEELAKLLMIALTLAIFRRKISNVYEYILVGAAVGFGFTLFEEFIYGSGSVVDSVGRLITVAGHMAFGIIMARHLGTAKYNKLSGEGSASAEYAKALLIPFIIHTLYDACTADNYMLESKNDNIVAVGTVLGIVSIIALFVMQLRVLSDFKRNAEKYCSMELISR